MSLSMSSSNSSLNSGTTGPDFEQGANTTSTNHHTDNHSHLPTIVCCVCGLAIESNPASMCAGCLESSYDITQGLTRSTVLMQCKRCSRFQKDANGWTACELGSESKELLAFCLRRVSGLKTVKLVDASFIWTEPHSKRIKLRLTVQGAATQGVILQQSCVVEFVIQNKMCDDCHRSEAKQTWNTVVQTRQKVDHKRTFLYLEQLILKYNAHRDCVKVASQPDGVDFFFETKNEGIRFLDFLSSVVPIRSKSAKKLLSADHKSNTANMNYTYSVEIVPLCKDDLVLLPKATAAKLGNVSRLLIVTQISGVVRLMDPFTCQICEISTERYWHKPFRPLLSAQRLTDYVILDVQEVDNEDDEDEDEDEEDEDEEEEEEEENLEDDTQDDGNVDEGSEQHENEEREQEGNQGDDHLPQYSSATVQSSKRKKPHQRRHERSSSSVSSLGDTPLESKKRKRRRKATGRNAKRHEGARGGSRKSHRHKLVEVEVARERDFGENDTRFTARCHLGFILHPGDHVLAYDMESTNLGALTSKEDEEYLNDPTRRPDLVIVKKYYPKWRKKHVKRNWEINRLPREELDSQGEEGLKEDERQHKGHGLRSHERHLDNLTEDEQRDYEIFMRDIEEDEEMRGNINVYKQVSRQEKESEGRRREGEGDDGDVDNDDDDDDDDDDDVDNDGDDNNEGPSIPLEDLLEQTTF